MSTAAATTGTSIDELKGELGVAAARQQAQNRPVKLLVVTGAVFLAAVIFLVVGVSKRYSADQDLLRAKNQASEILRLSERLNALKATAQQREGQGLGLKIDMIRSRIVSAGPEAGLKNPLPLPRDLTPGRGGAEAIQRRFEFDMRDESLAAIIRWIEISLERTSGLEVYAIALKPEATQWSCKVTFSRWEWDRGG